MKHPSPIQFSHWRNIFLDLSLHTKEGKGMKWEHSQPCKIKCTIRKGATELTEDGDILHSSLTFISCAVMASVGTGVSWAVWLNSRMVPNIWLNWLSFGSHWELRVSLTSQWELAKSHTKAKLLLNPLIWAGFILGLPAWNTFLPRGAQLTYF